MDFFTERQTLGEGWDMQLGDKNIKSENHTITYQHIALVTGYPIRDYAVANRRRTQIQIVGGVNYILGALIRHKFVALPKISSLGHMPNDFVCS